MNNLELSSYTSVIKFGHKFKNSTIINLRFLRKVGHVFMEGAEIYQAMES
jgi:hypothetical protein